MREYRVLMSNSEHEMEGYFNLDDTSSCLCFRGVREDGLTTFLRIAEDYNKFLVFIPEGLGEKEEDEEEN